MIICLDAQAALAQRAGVARYVRSLTEALARQPGPDQLRPFYFDFRHRAGPFSDAVPPASVCRWAPGRVVEWCWKTWGAPAFERFAPPADVYHFPNYVVPPLRRGTRAVVTVHDASFHRFPGTLHAPNLAYLRKYVGRSIARADAVLSVSEFAAEEFREFYPEARERIFGIPLGLSEAWQRPADDVIRAVRDRLGLSAPYILTVGTIEPRKNHHLLLDAWDRMRRDGLELVVAGRAGWKCDDVVDRLSRPGAGTRWLRFVEDADLPALYAGAEVFAFPSRYEGFGFPPLEAMACGTPVVASPHGSLREVLGDGAHLVGDDRPEAWAAALEEMVGSTDRRRDLAGRGRERVGRYTWEATAAQTREIYASVSGCSPASGDAPAPRR